jgi:hypothetical protein
MHHSPADHREYNDGLLVEHSDHLVVYDYDAEYLYDPIHHYLFDRPAAGAPTL